MLSKIDLIIIHGFLETNKGLFSKFCIDECIGTMGTGPATIKHVERELNASQPSVEADVEKPCNVCESDYVANYCFKCGRKIRTA